MQSTLQVACMHQLQHVACKVAHALLMHHAAFVNISCKPDTCMRQVSPHSVAPGALHERALEAGCKRLALSCLANARSVMSLSPATA